MAKSKILVVNDSLAQRSIFKDVLENAGYTVLEAGDGKEGLYQVGQESPDVCITDLSMPIMDGLQMIRKIKSDERTKYIPVICVSATYQDMATKLKALTEAGAEEYFYMPQNTDELLAKVIVMLRIRKIYTDLIAQNKALKDFTDAVVVKELELIELKKKVVSLEAELKKYKK